MGADIFGSLLNSFNGFPALPIFIGDFLLTQIKQYFYIPLTLAAVILAYHYITKQGGGQFTHIAVRAVTAVSIVWGILSFSTPMEVYIKEILGTNYERVKAKGNDKLEVENIDLEVFKDVEHFYIIQLMSTFITYSDNIANNLTRKIIYGTTDLNKISRDGTTEMIGYFPALIYNIKDNMSKRASKEAQEAIKDAKVDTYFEEKNNLNKSFGSGPYKEYETAMCKQGISFGFFDSKPRLIKGGSLLFYKDPENNTILDNPCDKLIKTVSETTDETTIEVSAIIPNYKEHLVPMEQYYNVLYEASLDRDPIQNDKGAYNINGPYYFYEQEKGAGFKKGWIGFNAKSTKNDLYESLAANANGKDLKKGFEVLKSSYIKSKANLSVIREFEENQDKLFKGVGADKINAIASYFNSGKQGGEGEDILLSAKKFLEENYKHQLQKLDNILKQPLISGALRSGNYSTNNPNNNDFLEFLSYLADSTNKYSDAIKKEIQNVSNDDSKSSPVTTAAGEMLVKDLTTQVYRVMVSFITMYDFDRTADAIYRSEGKTWTYSDVTKSYKDEGGEAKVALYAKKIGYEYSDVWRKVTVETIKTNEGKTYNGRFALDATPNDLFAQTGYVKGVSDFVSEAQDRHVVRKLALNEIQMMAATLADLSNEFDHTDPFLVARYNYAQQLRMKSALRQYASQAKLGEDNGLSKIKTIQGMFDVFNEIRPEGTYPLRAVERPIAWVDLGVFYSVFKSTYEQTVRDAFLISETGKRSEVTINNMDIMSGQLSREMMNDTGVKVAVAFGGATAIGGFIGDTVRAALDKDTTKTGVGIQAGKSLVGGAGMFLKIMAQMVTFVFFINILLPSGIWFIALVNYFIEISLYLAIAPISIILMIFQVYHMSVQKYINVLIVLLLYPSVLVSLYFIVLFLDMMLPLMIYSFIPFFNDASTVASVVKIAFGGGDGVVSDVANSIAEGIATTSVGASVGGLVAMGISMLLSLFLSTYLIFMILRAQSVLTSMMQGSGMNMMGDGQGFAGEAEQKLKMMGRQGAVVGGMTNMGV